MHNCTCPALCRLEFITNLVCKWIVYENEKRSSSVGFCLNREQMLRISSFYAAVALRVVFFLDLASLQSVCKRSFCNHIVCSSQQSLVYILNEKLVTMLVCDVNFEENENVIWGFTMY